MEYPKKIMNMSELERMGWGHADLVSIANSNKGIAWRSGNHKQSRVWFDTDALEKYRLQMSKATHVNY